MAGLEFFNKSVCFIYISKNVIYKYVSFCYKKGYLARNYGLIALDKLALFPVKAWSRSVGTNR